MAIEPIKKVTILSPRGSSKRLMKTVNGLGLMQVTDLKEIQESDEPSLQSCDVSTEEVDERLHQIDVILNLINVFSPEKQGFVQGLAPVPLVTSQHELNSVLKTLDLERAFARASELDDAYRSAERVISEIENELKELEPLSDLPFSLADFNSPERTRLALGYLSRKHLALLDDRTEPWSRVAWEEVATAPFGGTAASSEGGEERIRMVFASLAEDSDDLRKALAAMEFDEIQLPKLSKRVSERIGELRCCQQHDESDGGPGGEEEHDEGGGVERHGPRGRAHGPL